jgi:hypothetical protein
MSRIRAPNKKFPFYENQKCSAKRNKKENSNFGGKIK